MNTYDTSLIKPHIAYICMWVFGIAWAVLSETDVVPTEFLPHDAITDYNVSIISILTAIGGVYFALRLPAFKVVRRRLCETPDEGLSFRLYVRIALLRILIITIAVWTNAFLYYATSYAGSTQYCLLIAMIGAVFCWPTKSEFIGLRTAKAASPVKKNDTPQEEKQTPQEEKDTPQEEKAR